MNHLRGLVAFLSVFVFIFLFGFVWHGLLMKPSYLAMPEHWRAVPVFAWLIFGHVVLAFAFTVLYASKIAAPGIRTGLRYGLLIALFAVGADILRFATEPLSGQVLWLWILGLFLQFGITGAILGAIYRPVAVPE